MIIDMENVSLMKDGKWILKDIHWKVDKGESWVVYGLNGAGKTALLNTLCAYNFPTKGKMEVLGREFGKVMLGEELRKQIGFVSSSLQQKFNLSYNSFEIILSGAYASIGLYEKPTQEIREKAISLLEQLGCMPYANRSYGTLSQGEKQRVLIGRALMAEPGLLILDEPTNGLDFVAKEQLLDTIDKISRTENAPTLLYVTHHVDEILPVFSHTLLLKKGEVFATGKTKDVLTSARLSDFFHLDVEVLWNHDRPALVRA
ncbi:ABC transporter ATP-binding protein [Niallia oryzisoli]|uniref:ABC transporter ATP-binding protein n=1 Tax=Niallia oryzisoli TaxID=1737571 RepID=A0ABZ2C734_9BACI